MRRTGRLFDRVVERETLRLAAARALRGKRDNPEARRFMIGIDENLARIGAELSEGRFPFGCYHQFLIHEPKQRVITAPVFRERVAHHALVHVCAPTFERWLIDDTYACRVGRGRIATLMRAQQFMKRDPYWMKLDIRKYFDSIPHRELLLRLERIFKDRRILETFTQIVTSFRGSTGKGLPIGSLTSQYFANFYLGWFDREVKEGCRVGGYVRYMDDMLIWGKSLSGLRTMRNHLLDFLTTELDLTTKLAPAINTTNHGVDFLGCRLYRHRTTLNRNSRVRLRRKLAALKSLFDEGVISDSQRQQRETSSVAFATAGGVDSVRFRREMLQRFTEGG